MFSLCAGEIERLRAEIAELSEQELRTKLQTTKHKLIDDLTVDPAKLTRIYANQVQRRHSEYVERLHAEAERTYAEEQQRLQHAKQQAWLHALNATADDIERLGRVEEQIGGVDAPITPVAASSAAVEAPSSTLGAAQSVQATAANVSHAPQQSSEAILSAAHLSMPAACASMSAPTTAQPDTASPSKAAVTKPVSLIGRTNKTKHISSTTAAAPATSDSDKATANTSAAILPFRSSAAPFERNERGQRVRVVGGLFGGILVEDDADAATEAVPVASERPFRSMSTESFIAAMNEAQQKHRAEKADLHVRSTASEPPTSASTRMTTASTSEQSALSHFSKSKSANHQQLRGSAGGFATPSTSAAQHTASGTAASPPSPRTSPTYTTLLTSSPRDAAAADITAEPPTISHQSTDARFYSRPTPAPAAVPATKPTAVKYTYSWATGRPVRVAIADKSEEMSGVTFLDTNSGSKKPSASSATSPRTASQASSLSARLLAASARSPVVTSTTWQEDKRSTITHYGEHTSSYSIEFTTSRYFRR